MQNTNMGNLQNIKVRTTWQAIVNLEVLFRSWMIMRKYIVNYESQHGTLASD